MEMFILAASIKMGRNRGKGWRYLLMETCMLVNMNKERLRGMESTTGKVGHFIEDNFYQVCGMGRVHG